MELKISFDLESTARHLATQSLIAQNAARIAKEDLSKHIAEVAVAAGLGKGSLVTHIHAKANHGNLSDKIVTSMVINAFADHNMQPALRINLGRASGKGLSDYYATILLSDVIDCEQSTTLKYFGQ